MIPPAMKSAGTTHARVWFLAYHWRSFIASSQAVLTFG